MPDAPVDDSSGRSLGSRWPWLVTGAVAIVALAAATAYLTVSPADEGVRQTAVLIGAYGAEPGPLGYPYRWIRATAALRLKGSPRWLGFQAQSLGRPRTLRLTARGFTHTVRIGTKHSPYVVGPLPLGTRLVELRASPRGRRASKKDRRRVAVFISRFDELEEPLYPFYDVGFNPEEMTRRGAPYRWMMTRGRIRVLSGARSNQRVFLGFSAVSIERARTLTVSSRAGAAGRTTRIGTSALQPIPAIRVSVAPRRWASVTLTARPRAQRLGRTDPRVATVQLRNLGATTSAPETSDDSKKEGIFLLLGVTAALGGFALLVGRQVERAAVILLGATAPLEVYRTPVAGLNVSVFRIALALAAVVAVRAIWQTRGRVLAAPVLPGIYALFAAVAVASAVLTATDPAFGLRLGAQIATGCIAMLTLSVLVQRVSLEYAFLAVLVGAAPVLLLAVWQSIGPEVGRSGALPLIDHLPTASGLEVTRLQTVTLQDGVLRLKSTFADPNHFGVYLVFLLSTSLGLTAARLRRRSWQSSLAPASIALAVFLLALSTYSRTALLGCLVVLATVGLLVVPGPVSLYRGRVTSRVRYTIPAAAVLLALLVAPLGPAVAQRLRPAQDVNRVTNDKHESTVRAAWMAFGERPATGIGVGDLGSRLDQDFRTSGAHSTYLTVAAEMGAGGLLLLLIAAGAALIPLLRRVRRLRGSPDVLLPVGLLAACIAMLVMNVTYDVWWDDFHWVLLGLVLAASALDPGRSPVEAGRVEGPQPPP